MSLAVQRRTGENRLTPGQADELRIERVVGAAMAAGDDRCGLTRKMGEPGRGMGLALGFGPLSTTAKANAPSRAE